MLNAKTVNLIGQMDVNISSDSQVFSNRILFCCMMNAVKNSSELLKVQQVNLSSRNMIQEAAKVIWNVLMKTKGFDRTLNKINLISAANGVCKAEMTVSEEHTNPLGTLHGGLTATIVDSLSTIAFVTNKNIPIPGVSINFNITFINAAVIGDQILIEARTNKVGRNFAFLEVDITNKTKNKLIAKGSHAIYVATANKIGQI